MPIQFKEELQRYVDKALLGEKTEIKKRPITYLGFLFLANTLILLYLLKDREEKEDVESLINYVDQSAK